MKFNRNFKLYEDFDFNDVFDTNSDNNLSTASKLETLKYAVDEQLDTFIKDNFESKSEFNKFLIEFFDTGKAYKDLLNDEDNLNTKFIDLLHKIKSFDEFKKYGQGVHKLDNEWFRHSKIEHISLPDSLEYIGSYQFNESNLKEIEIPKNCNKICTFAFHECRELKTVTCSPRNPQDLKKYSGDVYISAEAFRWCSNLETVDLSNFIGLKRIYPYAFSKCNIKTLKLPNSLVSIDEFAFSSTVLETLDLSNTKVKKIASDCFYSSRFLKEVKFPKTLKTIGKNAFKNTALRKVHIPIQTRFYETSFPKRCHVISDL